ncbi:MAG: isopropylmalate/homocitrate/citramalate synthase [Rhodospirillales bacterium 20-60-12]|nr:MAG: isopropylmalate/homocitrate/citramalate synthase [Rhodospirillales bacterium 20-60-12]HQU01432.1 ketosteroid isomerase-related protein [Acetobacteraceae bacterium]
MTATALIEAYYAAFNNRDEAGFLDLLTDDVIHDINQGGREIGKPAFAAFLTRMNLCYRETIQDLVVMCDRSGTRAAAEFRVHGIYLQADEGLPKARGQTYILTAGAFFTLKAGKIARISNYYNLPHWLAQVGSE